MICKEDFEKLINNLRDKLDETTVALVSEEILATISAYNNGFDEYEKSIEEVEKLKGEKEELLKVNGAFWLVLSNIMKLFWLCVILLIEERIMMLGYILVEDIFDEMSQNISYIKLNCYLKEGRKS